MRIALIFAAVILAAIVTIGVLVEGTKSDMNSSRMRENAVKLAAQEPTCAKAWIEGSTLYVYVNDDGTRRDGLAASYCAIVKDSAVSDVFLMAAGTSKGVGRCTCE